MHSEVFKMWRLFLKFSSAMVVLAYFFITKCAFFNTFCEYAGKLNWLRVQENNVINIVKYFIITFSFFFSFPSCIFWRFWDFSSFFSEMVLVSALDFIYCMRECGFSKAFCDLRSVQRVVPLQELFFWVQTFNY
jgi:hypothetical protein